MGLDIAKERFEKLYRREADAIFRFCLFRTSDRESALDLTQDAFVRFWEAHFKGEDGHIKNERAFLFTIARNLVIDWYRKKKALSLEALMEESEGGGGAEVLLKFGGLGETESALEARWLLEKISELEPIYQQAVYLRFVEDLRPQEIATILGQTENVVSVRISRGLKKLKELGGYG